MYPNVTFLSLDLYAWFLVLGAVAAIVIARVLADKKQIPAKLQNICYLIAALSIVSGYGFAVLFQAVYNFCSRGVFEINRETGATFYGGLIGGGAVFLVLYFTLVKKLCGNTVTEQLNSVTGIAACAVTLGHSIGRIGCLMAGCCYGIETDSWIGIYLPAIDARVIPTQLIEAVFLFLLFLALCVLLFRTKINGFAVYLVAYGVFRFTIEFWRGDDRGSFLGAFLSPSQIWSIVFILTGIVLLVWQAVKRNRQALR